MLLCRHLAIVTDDVVEFRSANSEFQNIDNSVPLRTRDLAPHWRAIAWDSTSDRVAVASSSGGVVVVTRCLITPLSTHTHPKRSPYLVWQSFRSSHWLQWMQDDSWCHWIGYDVPNTNIYRPVSLSRLATKDCHGDTAYGPLCSPFFHIQVQCTCWDRVVRDMHTSSP